jgi:hypothetical protein
LSLSGPTGKTQYRRPVDLNSVTSSRLSESTMPDAKNSERELPHQLKATHSIRHDDVTEYKIHRLVARPGTAVRQIRQNQLAFAQHGLEEACHVSSGSNGPVRCAMRRGDGRTHEAGGGTIRRGILPQQADQLDFGFLDRRTSIRATHLILAPIRNAKSCRHPLSRKTQAPSSASASCRVHFGPSGRFEPGCAAFGYQNV